jgi:hypothetical protein
MKTVVHFPRVAKAQPWAEISERFKRCSFSQSRERLESSCALRKHSSSRQQAIKGNRKNETHQPRWH